MAMRNGTLLDVIRPLLIYHQSVSTRKGGVLTTFVALLAPGSG